MELQANNFSQFKLKLEDYIGIVPKIDLVIIQRLADRFAGRQFLHINSTKSGGGVAEILQRMMIILSGLGINARCEVIEGDERFFDITKKIHHRRSGRAFLLLARKMIAVARLARAVRRPDERYAAAGGATPAHRLRPAKSASLNGLAK